MINNLKDLKNNLHNSDLQEMSNKCNSINFLFKGNDGSGLIGGCLIYILVSKYFEIKLDTYKTFHKGEA